MNRLAPFLVLVLVTTLLGVYGRFAWSPLLGPLAAYGLWKLERYAAAARGDVDVEVDVA